MDAQQWQRQAASHTRCSQILLVLHHTLLLPSILAPPVVSLFEASSGKINYTIIGASAATATSLALKLELRAYVHMKAARDYLLLAFAAQHGPEHLRNRVTQLLREAPLLPWCLRATVVPRVHARTRDDGEPADRDV